MSTSQYGGPYAVRGEFRHVDGFVRVLRLHHAAVKSSLITVFWSDDTIPTPRGDASRRIMAQFVTENNSIPCFFYVISLFDVHEAFTAALDTLIDACENLGVPLVRGELQLIQAD